MVNVRTQNAKISGRPTGVSLADLRWLVAQAEGAKGDILVRVSQSRWTSDDPGGTFLSIEVPILATPVDRSGDWSAPPEDKRFVGPYGDGPAQFS